MSSEYLDPVPHTAPGCPFPLGATPVDGDATQFAVHAPDAEAAWVCLIAKSGVQTRVPLRQQTYGIWHGVVEEVVAGQRYGYRVDGPWAPRRGLRANAAKLLLDPWGKRISGKLGDPRALHAYDDDPFGARSTVDSLGHTPVSVVTPPGVRTTGPRLETPWEETVIRQIHVGSHTANHPHVPPAYRGTYLGLAEPAVIGHLLRIGITAVELLSVHAFLADQESPASYFAPHPGYAAVRGQEIAEFHTMVDALHAAGIEVILDVAYTHTCEHGVDGISIGWRGLDAQGYYLLNAEGVDIDLTGHGNTVDAHSPISVRMITDSLRYWAGDMGVDGFRFDLAAALGRRGGGPFDPHASVFAAIAADPLLSRCKLVAQPRDATPNGDRTGHFDRRWSECNDSYGDAMQRFWNGDTGVRDFASRFTGSQDLFRGRRPWASINIAATHEAFTASHLRALLATVAFSTGTPLFSATYDWDSTDLASFVGRALALRRAAPALRQSEFFGGRDTPTEHADIVWFDGDGTEMNERTWHDDSLRTVQAWIDGSDVRAHTEDGHQLTDDSWLLVFHTGGSRTVTLGYPEWFFGTFRGEFDSTASDGAPSMVVATDSVPMDGPTLLAFRAVG